MTAKTQATQPATSPAVAYSYVRFSTPEQQKGDSLRRQTEAAADWCKRHEVQLDTATTLHDLGKSAYTGRHRENPDRNALAAFLKLVEAGKVPRGSYLVIENLDRLSREHIQPALLLALNLLQNGIRIVQLKPVEMVFDDKSDTMPVMMMMMELSRGHGESAIKSERNGACWRNKRAAARARQKQPPRRKDGRVSTSITDRLPLWVEERGGKRVEIPERGAVVRRIFQMTAAGYGLASVVKTLTRENVPPFRAGGTWNRGYVGLILRDRRALGEWQPCSADKPDGDVIKDYYPRVVTEEQWAAARAAAKQRKTCPGRIGRHVNLFAGILRNARDHDTYYIFDKDPANTRRVLVNLSGAEGRTKYETFPADLFEKVVLEYLREIDPREILNGDQGPDESQVLAGRLAHVQADIDKLTAVLLEGDSLAVGRLLRAKEAELKDLAEKLAQAQQKARYPLSASWGEAQSLAAALESAPDPEDARLRLRAALRRIIAGIWILIVVRGRQRLCAVQVWFADRKKQRTYLIWHKMGHGGMYRVQPPQEKWWTLDDVLRLGALDLRKLAHAARLEKALTQLDLDALQTL
jgi:DNA invertase Pin-like site-specific DNA recombinase